jgi:hypothetical protein
MDTAENRAARASRPKPRETVKKLQETLLAADAGSTGAFRLEHLRNRRRAIMRFSLPKTAAGLVAACVSATLGTGRSSAEIKEKVFKACESQLRFTANQLSPEQSSESCKSKQSTPIAGKKHDGDVTWSFYFVAYLSAKKGAPNATLSLDFYTGNGADKKRVASKSVSGVDPKANVLQSHVEVTAEDDDFKPSTTYEVKLVGDANGKEVVFATGTLQTK